MQRCITIYDSNVDSFATHNFDELPFFLLQGEIVDSGFEAIPPADYELPKKFPTCCKWHSGLLTHYIQWFNKFPNCCKWHKEISQKIWFEKESFNGIPFKILRNVTFTTYHIERKASSDDWYEEIINYIEYNLASFGSPAIGANLYIDHLKHYLKHTKLNYLAKEKRNRILEYLADQIKNNGTAQVDPNELYRTFQTWLKLIPDLSIFSNFKLKYAGKVPNDFLFYGAEYNPYLKLSKFRIRTPKQFTKLLLDFTKDALANVNSAFLLENGTIPNIFKHQFDIAGSKLKINQETLLGRYSKGELKYLEVMQKWLANEEEYFISIAPLLKNAEILPDLPRINAGETTTSVQSTHNYHFNEVAKVQIVQGNNATLTDSSGDGAHINISPSTSSPE